MGKELPRFCVNEVHNCIARTLANVSSALLLCGFGTGGKLACVFYTADRDLRWRVHGSLNEAQEPLLIPTMLGFGALLGCFSGSFFAGFAYFYLGMGEAIYVLLGLEAVTVAVSFVFAFKRNYRSPRNLAESEERHPILES
ncbi:hypothetical protein AVEN_184465-1 [Araneus ventricosus]|uniref:Transmembrane protein n=1 Tax=Araneus ventricosus TaxID=182803 RepID=A0A4Y2BGD0_ARAVE|nr:hypothetical protein AVEN_184465-1 [Araneus ventricosus]